MKCIVKAAVVASMLYCAHLGASSIIEDEWVQVRMTSDRGDRVVLASDGPRLTRFELIADGSRRKVDVTFARELKWPAINGAKVLVDGTEKNGRLVRHVVIPFESWGSAGQKDVSLMMTFEATGMVRAVVLVDGDIDKPIHVFESP